jgi:glutathione S-transferase
MTLRLYYFPTPNGRKVSIALEEMGLAYEIERVNILEGEQARPEFLALCPNGRIPALVDAPDGAEPVVIFESGAILQYLGRRSGLFYPAAEAKRAAVDSWLFWQMAGLGPMTGQVTWFRRAGLKPGRDPRDVSFAIHRYEKEMRRLYDVLERQLTGREFICDGYSLADMASWPWVDQHGDYLGDLAQFPAIRDWHARIRQRPAVQRAMQVGTEGLPQKQR